MLPGTNPNPIIDSRYIDSSGFLIGQRRLKELNDNVKQIDKTTDEILNILRGELKQQAAETKVVLNSIDDVLKKISAKATIRVSNSQSQAANNTGNAGNSNQSNGQPASNNPLGRRTTRINRTVNNAGQDTQESQNDSAERSSGSKRNSKGQFESDGSDNQGSGIRGLTRAIRAGFEMVNAPDTRGIDPTVEAVHEISQLVSPAGRAFKAMGKGAMWLFGRRKPKDEALPKEQAKHNRTLERQMERLIDAIRRKGGSALGGLGSGFGAVGGFFGRGAKGAGKFGLKALRFLRRAPVIGSIIGAATLGYDLFNSKTAEDKGRALGKFGGGMGGAGAGAVIGTAIFPGVGTAVGAVLGGVLGSTVGETIGGKFGEWTKKLIEADLPGRLMGTWATFTTDLSEYFRNKKDQVIGEALDARDTAFDWIDRGRAWLGDKEAQQRVEFNKKYGRSNVPEKNIPKQQAHHTSQLPPRYFGDTKNTDNQMMVYRAALANGFSENQAIALTAEVGRENSYKDSAMFGKHTDPNKNTKRGVITNQGIFSWNGARRTELVKHMKAKGLVLPNGDFVKSQESVNAQMQFAYWEMKNRPEYTKTKNQFLDNPDIDPQEAATGALPRNYIGWAIDNPKYSATGLKNRHEHQENLMKKLDGSSRGSSIKLSGLPSTTATPIVGMPQPTIPKAVNVPKVQEMPIINKQIGTKPPQVVQIAPNADTIGQNVSDRQIAHAVTGGLGMRWNE